jgi:glutamyl-tRNA synthetase
VHVAISGATLEVKSLLKHKKNPDVGMKETLFGPDIFLEQEDAASLEVGEEVTLMDWGNAIITSVKRSGDMVEKVEAKLHLEGDFKKTKKKLTWLTCTPHANAPVEVSLHDFDYLITKKKLESDDKFEDFLSPKTEFITECLGDSNLAKLKKGDVVQLERKGYYICDSASPIRLFLIPDGKVASLASKNAAPEEAAKPTEAEPKTDKKAKEIKQMYNMDSIYAKIEVVKSDRLYPIDSIYNGMEIQGAPAVSAKKVEKSDKAAAKQAKPAKKAKVEVVEAAPDSPISRLDMCVGVIKSVKKHPDADTLYVEEIDVGEPTPRTVVSGLVKFMTEDQMLGKTIVVLKNLKPVSMRGVKSHAMVLCASSADHSQVEFLIPPAGSVPGDVIFFDGHVRAPEAVLNPKKKLWESVQPDFTTREDLVAVWNGLEFKTSKGVVKAGSLVKAQIK